jgi:hypothetical protein
MPKVITTNAEIPNLSTGQIIYAGELNKVSMNGIISWKRSKAAGLNPYSIIAWIKSVKFPLPVAGSEKI